MHYQELSGKYDRGEITEQELADGLVERSLNLAKGENLIIKGIAATIALNDARPGQFIELADVGAAAQIGPEQSRSRGLWIFRRKVNNVIEFSGQAVRIVPAFVEPLRTALMRS